MPGYFVNYDGVCEVLAIVNCSGTTSNTYKFSDFNLYTTDV